MTPDMPSRFNPSWPTRAVMERATAMADGGFVTPQILIRALAELRPDLIDEFASPGGAGLYHRLGVTNELLGRLCDDLRSLGAAMQANTQEESDAMTTITEAVQEFTAVANQARDDSAAARDVTNRAIAAMQALETALAGAGLTADQQAAVASAVADLGQAHADLVQRVSDLGAASDAASPPTR